MAWCSMEASVITYKELSIISPGLKASRNVETFRILGRWSAPHLRPYSNHFIIKCYYAYINKTRRAVLTLNFKLVLYDNWYCVANGLLVENVKRADNPATSFDSSQDHCHTTYQTARRNAMMITTDNIPINQDKYHKWKRNTIRVTKG